MTFPRLVACLLGLFYAAAAGVAQTFNPGDYGAVTLHLKADALVQATNTPVTAWGSLTASGSNSPTYIASDARFNNQPVVRFDGVDDVLKWTGANLNAQTIFVVASLESGAGTLVGLIGTGGDTLNIRRNNTTNFYRSAGQGMDANDFAGNGTPTGNLYVNNVVSGAYTPGTPHIVAAAAGGLKSYGNFWVGSASAALGRYWNGSIAEILVYSGALTSDSVNRVGYYLQNKYNIAGSTYPPPTAIINSYTATAGSVTAKSGVLSTAGAPVTLTWNVAAATSLSIDNGAQASTTTGAGSVIVSPVATTTYTLSAVNAAGTVTRAVTVYIGTATQPLMLSEFLADNGSSIRDEDGTAQGWIELYNPNPFAVPANGWQLVSGTSVWTFPSLVVEGGAYPVVFASAKNRVDPAAPLHTNFVLAKNGSYLALKQPDGTVVNEFAPSYPEQRRDVSYGLNAGAAGFFSPPTPGAANGAPLAGFVADTSFTAKRGFFLAPFQVAITCDTVGATIRYTTDKSTPTESTGLVYTTPLFINATTVLRVRAFKAGLVPSDTETQTYLFVSDVPNQVYAAGTAPAGWPVSGSAQLNGQVMRYGFNATLKAQYTNQQLLDALKQVPSISIVTDQPNLTGQATGIYNNADQKGDSWERPASVEYLLQDNSAGFHIDCGLRIRGGASRGDGYTKHSFRLFFRNQYGEGTLKYPFHGPTGTDEFQTIDIRSEQNYSWANDTGTENTAVREVFCRDLAGAMGQPQTRSRYIHVYLNGQYWGLYMTEERSQEDYAASYLGGSSNDYDVVQTSNHPNFTYELGSGTINAWQQTWNLARACAANPTNANYFALLGRDANGVRVPAMPVYVDPDHLATYMLLHYYSGDGDGPLSNYLALNRANNWRGLRNRLTETGWRFFPHDCEHTLLAPNWLSTRATGNATAGTTPTNGSNRSNFTYSNSEWLHEDLATNPEYRLKIADVAQKHLFNNGALTTAKAQALFDARAAQITQAIIADCARWGSSATNHTLAQWQARLNAIRTNFFPVRPDAVKTQLKARGFYPAVDPPTFSQRGGQVSAGYGLTLSAGTQTGTIYYTLDGSDPRAVGGAVAGTAYSGPIVINQPGTVRTRFQSSSNVWSALDEAVFTTFPPAAAGTLVVSKLQYHPPGPTPEESSAGYSSADDFEYIELLNVGAETIDLRGVSLSNAVTFSFTNAPITALAPGARVLVVANSGAFAKRYGPGLPIAGVFVGHFKDSDEVVRVSDVIGAKIVEFTYFDSPPWPIQADGDGAAMVLVDPSTNPDPTLPESWRASYVSGGLPGVLDQWTVSLWRSLYFPAADLADAAKEATVWGDTADPDLDGSSNYAEFVLGSSPTDPRSRPQPLVSIWTDPTTSVRYLSVTCKVREGVSGVSVRALASGDLVTWEAGLPQVGGAVSQGDGTALVTYRDTVSLGGSANRRFLRMSVQAN